MTHPATEATYWFPDAASRTTEHWTRDANDRAAVEAGCWFDADAAAKAAIFFARFCRHSTGRFKGKPFILATWQWQRIIAPLFGWKRKEGSRRFRRAGIFVAKKMVRAH